MGGNQIIRQATAILLFLFISNTFAGALFSIYHDLKTLDSTYGTTKDTFVQGEAIKLRTRVSNFGDTGAYVRVYHEIWSGSARKYAGNNQVSVASMNDAYSYMTPTLSASTYPAGEYTYKAYLSPCDPAAYTCERTKTFTVTSPSPAALGISSLRASNTSGGSSKSTFTQGETVYMKATVENTGGTSGTTTISFKIKKDGTTACTATQSVTVQPSDTASATKSCATATAWAAGTYDYEASISPCTSDSCSESDTFTLVAPGPVLPPNFSTDSLYMDNGTSGAPKSDFTYGERLILRATGRNTGPGAGTGTYGLYVTNSAGATVHSYTTSSSVNAGSTYYAYTTIPVNLTAGAYTCTTTVSPCSSPNVCRQNMTFSVTGSAPVPKFSMDSTWADNGTTGAPPKQNFTAGERIMLRTSGRNTGNLTGSSNSNFYVYNSAGTSVYSSSATASSVSIGGTYYSYAQITAGLSAGTYRFRVSVTPCAAPDTCEMNTTLYVTSPPTPSPSFSIDSSYADNGSSGAAPKTEFRAGERIILRTTGRNAGTLGGTGAHGFYLHNSSGAVVRSYSASSWVNKGSTYYKYYTVTGSLPAGAYIYRTTVSPCNAATGTCEKNLTLRVGLPPLSPSFTLTGASINGCDGTAGCNLTTGDIVSLRADILNNGTATGSFTGNLTVRREGALVYSESTSYALNNGSGFSWNTILGDTRAWTGGNYEYRVSISPCSAPNVCTRAINFTEAENFTRKNFSEVLSENPDYLGIPMEMFVNVTTRLYESGIYQTDPGAAVFIATVDLFANNTGIVEEIAGSHSLAERWVIVPTDMFIASRPLATATGETIDEMAGWEQTTVYTERGTFHYYKKIGTPAIDEADDIVKTYKDFKGAWTVAGYGIAVYSGAKEGWSHGNDTLSSGSKMFFYGATNLGLGVMTGAYLAVVGLATGTSEIVIGTLAPGSSLHSFFREFNQGLAAFPLSYTSWLVEDEECGLFSGGLVIHQLFFCIPDNMEKLMDRLNTGIASVDNPRHTYLGGRNLNFRAEVTNVWFHSGDVHITAKVTNKNKGAEEILNARYFYLEPNETVTADFDWAVPAHWSLSDEYELEISTWDECSPSYPSSGSCTNEVSTGRLNFTIAENRAPEIIELTYNETVQQGEKIVLRMVVFDPDDDAVEIRATFDGPLTINQSDSNGTNPETYTWIMDTTRAGPGAYGAVFRASDGVASAERAINFSVTPGPSPPAPIYPIQLVSPANGSTMPYSTSQNFTWNHVPNATYYVMRAYNPATGRTNSPVSLSSQTIARYCTAGTCAPPWIVLARGNYLWNVTGTLRNGTTISSETRAIRIS